MFDDFFVQHPVFRYEELHHYLNKEQPYKETTLKASLRYHLQKKHIARIRQGFYAVTDDKYHTQFDPLLIAGRINQEVLIAYHSALTFHGVAYSLASHVYYISPSPIKTFDFQQVTYQRVAPHKTLLPDHWLNESKKYDRFGLDICVTSMERALVDCLDRPQFSGGFEEIWRSVSMINFIDAERMAHYAISLRNATTIAKVGFFLEAHQENFHVDDKVLSLLENKKPKSTHYLSRESTNNQHNKRWNLMIPLTLKQRIWEEENHDF